MRDRLRTWLGASALCVALLALTPAIAGGVPERTTETRVVVKRVGDTERVIVNGIDVEEARAKCQGRRAASDVMTDENGRRSRTRIILCSEGTQSRASLVDALENAKREVAGKDVDKAHRQRVRSALDAEIARLRSGR